jgi:hypothetical protein
MGLVMLAAGRDSAGALLLFRAQDQLGQAALTGGLTKRLIMF